LDLLKKESPTTLNTLKEQSGLSNKKWDKAIKVLTKNKVAKVFKNDQGLWVELLGN
jgi:lysyl-tRNA synthetase class 2